jgi:hypothetical protein
MNLAPQVEEKKELTQRESIEKKSHRGQEEIEGEEEGNSPRLHQPH